MHIWLMEKLGLKSRETFRKNYMNPALELGIVQMTIPDKPNSRNRHHSPMLFIEKSGTIFENMDYATLIQISDVLFRL